MTVARGQSRPIPSAATARLGFSVGSSKFPVGSSELGGGSGGAGPAGGMPQQLNRGSAEGRHS